MSGYGYQTKQGYWEKVKAKELAELKGIPNKCSFCGTDKNLTIDHILPKATNPKARGYLANYRLLCVRCNEKSSGQLSLVVKYKKLIDKMPFHEHLNIWQSKLLRAKLSFIELRK